MPQSQSDNQTDSIPHPDEDQPAGMPSTTATATTSNSKKRKQPGEKTTKTKTPAKKPAKKEKVDGFLLAAKGWAAAASKDLAPYLERILKKEADEKARMERRERGEASPPPSSPSSSLDSPDDVTLPTPKSKQKPKPPISNHHRLQQREYQQQRKAAAAAAAAAQKTDQQLNDVVQKAFESGHNGHLAASIGRQLDKMMLTNGTTATTTTTARPSHAGPSSFTGRAPLPRLVPAPSSSTDHHRHNDNNTSKRHKSNTTTFKVKVYAGPEGTGWSRYYEPTQHAQQHDEEGKDKESLRPPPPPPPPHSNNNNNVYNTKLSDVFDTPPGLSLLGPAPDHQYHPQPVDMTPFTTFLLAQNMNTSHQQQQQMNTNSNNNNNNNGAGEDIDYEALQDFIGELEFSKDDPALRLGDGGAAAATSGGGNNYNFTAAAAHEQERQRNDRIMQSHAEAVVAELQFTLPMKPTTSPSVVSPGLAAMLSCMPPANTNGTTTNIGTSSSMQRRTTRSSGNGLFSPKLEEGCGIPSSAAMFNSPGELPGLMSPSVLAAHLPF